MFCPKCGTQLPDGGAFCPSCGHQMNQQAAPQTSVSQSSGSNGGAFFADLLEAFKANVKDPKSWGIPGYLMVGGAALYFVSMFMPYLSMYFLSASFVKSGAIHVILAILLVLASAFAAITKKGIVMLGTGAVMFLFTIIEAIGNSEEYLSFAVGFYFMLISSIAILAGGIMKFREDKK